MTCDFPTAGFEHCNRETNMVAHELARVARFSTTYDWPEEPLNYIVTLLLDDVTAISIYKTLFLNVHHKN